MLLRVTCATDRAYACRAAVVLPRLKLALHHVVALLLVSLEIVLHAFVVRNVLSLVLF